MAYMVNAVAPTVAYVSTISANGIPVGSDTTGLGTSASPLATIDRAIAICKAPAIIWVNGVTATPTLYTLSTITAAVTLKCVTPLGAKLAAPTGTTYAFQVGVAAGETVTIQDFIVDASLNTAGQALNCVGLSAQSTTYTFVAINCKFQGFTGTTTTTNSSGIVGIGTFKGNITLTNCDIVGDTCKSGVHVGTYRAGAFVMSDGAVTLTNQRDASSGGIVLQADTVGVTASISSVTGAVGLDTSLTGVQFHYGVFTQNITATVSGGDWRVTGHADQHQGYPAWIYTSGSPQDISGSSISGVTAYLDCYNGVTILIGSDGAADQTKRANCSITNCIASASAYALTAGVHGIMMGFTGLNCFMTGNASTNEAIPFVDKENLGLTMTGNTATDGTSTCFLTKGSTGTICSGNTATQHSGFTGNMRYIEQNDVTGTNATGIADADNIYINAGATGPVWVKVDANQTATFLRGSYTLSSGAENATPFTYLGVGKTDAQWKAQVEPTATGNIF